MSEDRQHPSSSEKDAAKSPAEADIGSVATPGGPRSRREQGSLGNLYAPGSHVGRYRLLAPLATGGMAQVWAAKPEGAGFARTIALKLIRHEYAMDEEYARMFIDEATVAASIHHPNVCETYELGREEGALFMAIEWVAGDSLAGLLHREAGLEPIAETLAARILADACAGLHAAHEALGPDGAPLGVVHRDVSPPNILLSLHGQVKVSDFGIAKARLQIHSKTRTGEIKGKFAYIAPEQIGGKVIDRRADIFALGCILYVATLGLRPFGSGPRAMGKILAGEYKRPSELVEPYSPELERIIVRCLQKLPSDRYQTADEMRLDLERWLLAASEPVGTKDLANLVKSRLDPQKRQVVETLLRSNQFLPDAMVYQLVRGEIEQTPTATSSVMFGPLSNPSMEVAANRSESPRASQKPMVRFTALGKPLSPDSSSKPQQQDDKRPSLRPDSPDEPTAAEGLPASLLLSSAPPRSDTEAGPTYRPPRLRPITAVRTGETAISRKLVQYIRPLLAIVLLLVALGIGWASCQH